MFVMLWGKLEFQIKSTRALNHSINLKLTLTFPSCSSFNQITSTNKTNKNQSWKHFHFPFFGELWKIGNAFDSINSTYSQCGQVGFCWIFCCVFCRPSTANTGTLTTDVAAANVVAAAAVAVAADNLTQFLIRDDDNKPVECQFPWPGKAKTKENREAKTARKKKRGKKNSNLQLEAAGKLLEPNSTQIRQSHIDDIGKNPFERLLPADITSAYRCCMDKYCYSIVSNFRKLWVVSKQFVFMCLPVFVRSFVRYFRG